MYHKPVLLEESIEGLAIKPDGIYVDATFGGGGHSAEILKRLKKGKLIAFEQDEEAFRNKINDEKLLLLNNNFRYMKNFLNYYKVDKIDGLIADLGVSSYQFDTAERGFSIRFDSGLDMRMNKNKNLTAKKILNDFSSVDLTKLFYDYGELSNAKMLARDIIEFRTVKQIETTQDLMEAIKKHIPKFNANKFLSRVFQALRIVVNDEIESLKEMLLQSVDIICTNGRLVVISYHSLEDRLVKNIIRSGNFEGNISKDFYGNPMVPFKQINRNVITAGDEELSENSRARSAKLRIAEKI